MATGAATALGELGINKIFGSGNPLPLEEIIIPKKFIPMLPAIRGEFTKSQRDLINKAYQTGGQLVIKPTRKQIEGGFLGTLASTGIPMAISLVSKMFGGGLQVDRQQMFTFHPHMEKVIRITLYLLLVHGKTL